MLGAANSVITWPFVSFPCRKIFPFAYQFVDRYNIGQMDASIAHRQAPDKTTIKHHSAHFFSNLELKRVKGKRVNASRL